MNNYVFVETPGGTICAEIERTEEVDEIILVSSRSKRFPSFHEACDSLKENAKHLLNTMKELSPDEVEVSCGIKIAAEGGNTFWGLAKTSGEAGFTVTLKWKADEVRKTD